MTTVDTIETQARNQLPEGWRVVRFDQMADSITERVDNPAEAGVTYYVGLEHLDPESLHIRRWGAPTDVEATKLRFQQGDIIFGRRRAYQRKIAVAEFEGICSAHALVLRAKEETVAKEFLPFFMQSDIFFERAMSISVGSLSPTINWKTLAQQEFAIPPKDEQRRIAEILWAADEAIHSNKAVIEQFQQAKQSIIEHLLTNGINNHKLKETPIGNIPETWQIATAGELQQLGYIIALQDGNHGGQYPRQNQFTKEGVIYLSASNIDEDGSIDFDNCPRLHYDVANNLRIPPAHRGDVILTNNATVGRVALLPESVDAIVASTSTTYYRTNKDKLLNLYLKNYFLTVRYQKQLKRVMVQSTRNQVPITAQRKLLIIVPPIAEQEIISQIIDQVDAAMNQVKDHLYRLINIKSNLTNRLLNSAGISQ